MEQHSDKMANTHDQGFTVTAFTWFTGEPDQNIPSTETSTNTR